MQLGRMILIPVSYTHLDVYKRQELETREYTIELTNGQKNAVIRAYEEENFWHVSRNYLINDVLVGFDRCV